MKKGSLQPTEISGDDTYHATVWLAGSTDVYCRDCGRRMPDQAVGQVTTYEEHNYDDNGVCDDCQHQRNPRCQHLHKQTWQFFVYSD